MVSPNGEEYCFVVGGMEVRVVSTGMKDGEGIVYGTEIDRTHRLISPRWRDRLVTEEFRRGEAAREAAELHAGDGVRVRE